MPGFVFHFRCKCGAISDSYPALPFPSTFEPDLVLPTWCLRHKFWGSFSAVLTENDRFELEKNHDRLLELASSISSESMTVGVPQFVSGGIQVEPLPTCPKCGEPCESIFGYPPHCGSPAITPEMMKDFDSIPIALAELSVRARMICKDIGINTLGDLCDNIAKIADHPRVTENVIREVDRVLATKPTSDS